MSQAENVTMTAGIVNIPLTKPAKIFFVCKDKEHFSKVNTLLESFKIPFTVKWTKKGTVGHFISDNEIESLKLKMIWKNFKTLRPRMISNWRYLFFEVDTHDMAVVNKVVSMYSMLKLPVYFHQTLHGYHFLSVKPIENQTFRDTVKQLMPLNPKYPPLTLRLIPNKSATEKEIWMNSCIVSEKYHYDTENLKQLIESQRIDDIGQRYIVVWYKI